MDGWGEIRILAFEGFLFGFSLFGFFFCSSTAWFWVMGCR